MTRKLLFTLLFTACVSYSYAQHIVGRIDSTAIQREVVADDGIGEALAEVPDVEYRYRVNGKAMTENEADIRVRPWNVRSIRSRRRDDGAVELRMRAGKLTRKYLKGNISGVRWDSRWINEYDMQRYNRHIYVTATTTAYAARRASKKASSSTPKSVIGASFRPMRYMC